MWTDTLAALAPAAPAPNIQCLKLDSNSLAYLSSTFFNEAMDALLAKLPSLRALHLGNNQLDAAQAVGLAKSLKDRGVGGMGGTLASLTLGSNDVGDSGLAAILEVLPSGCVVWGGAPSARTAHAPRTMRARNPISPPHTRHTRLAHTRPHHPAPAACTSCTCTAPR